MVRRVALEAVASWLRAALARPAGCRWQRGGGLVGGDGGMSAEGPTVSVTTIFLDEGRFIGKAMGSVFAQTYGYWELLLVDDASTDASARIVGRSARRHPVRVRYLHHPGRSNRGMRASRNLGPVI